MRATPNDAPDACLAIGSYVDRSLTAVANERVHAVQE